MNDRLSQMFEQQRQFMDLLRERRNFPDFPVDLSSKNGQKFCKSIAYEMMGEIFEAIQELKNLGIEEDDIDDEIKKAKSQKEELDRKKSELEEEIEEKITEAESILRK